MVWMVLPSPISSARMPFRLLLYRDTIHSRPWVYKTWKDMCKETCALKITGSGRDINIWITYIKAVSIICALLRTIMVTCRSHYTDRWWYKVKLINYISKFSRGPHFLFWVNQKTASNIMLRSVRRIITVNWAQLSGEETNSLYSHLFTAFDE